jgi:hypothetical protein
MSTTLHATQVGRADRRPNRATFNRWRATVALARVEAIRLLRHPVIVAAALLFIGPLLYRWLTGTANRFAILHDEDRSMQFSAMLLLGGAALVVANLAALRARRHRTAAFYDVLVLPNAWRIGAHLLALMPFALLAAALVAARIGVHAATSTAVGEPNPYELATSPVVVLLAGASGVLLARLATSAVVAPLAVVGLGVLTFAGWSTVHTSIDWMRWLLPVAAPDEPMPLPADLLDRPAARHLGYLVGLTVLVAVAALALAGARGRRLIAATAAGSAIAVIAGAAQFVPPGVPVVAARIVATERPHEQQTCQRIGQVMYCVFPDFTPWITSWDAVVRGVLRRVPAAEAQRPLVIRQRVRAHDDPRAGGFLPIGAVQSREQRQAWTQAWRRADRAAGTPNTVAVGTVWGNDRSQTEFAGLVAYEVITRAGAGVDVRLCGALGVLIGWLVGQATPETAAGLRQLDAASFGAVPFREPSFFSGVSVDDREMTVALELLKRPTDETAAAVLRAWDELSAPRTPTERVGELLGIPVPPAPPAREHILCEG